MFPAVRKYDDPMLCADYVRNRPKYPTQIINTILDYIEERKDTTISGRFPLAVDVGCGPGVTSTSPLSPYFDKVLGVDISEAQIREANLHNEFDNIEYKVTRGETLPLDDNSVTLVQVATGLPFLDHEKFYRECDRVLVPGGVIAAYTYSCQEYRVVGHPNAWELSAIMNEIPERVNSSQNPESSNYNMMVIRKYTDPNLQIPYADRKRVDNVYMNVHSTIAGFLEFYLSASFVRKYVNSCSETMAWWKTCGERMMESYGRDDPEAPLTYQKEVFMLLGRKS